MEVVAVECLKTPLEGLFAGVGKDSVHKTNLSCAFLLKGGFFGCSESPGQGIILFHFNV